MTLNIYFTKSIIIPLSITSVLIASNIIGATLILFAQTNGAVNCIKYDSLQKLIHINCKSIHLNDIYQSIKNTSILGIENGTGVDTSTSKGKVWILNAGITIEKDGELVIDSTDTSWLKIVPTPTIQKNGQTGLSANESNDDTNNDYQGADAISYPSNIKHYDRYNSHNAYNSDTNEQKPVNVNRNNGDNPNGIHVFGSLKINSVKITSCAV